jgi:hypothetical protein
MEDKALNRNYLMIVMFIIILLLFSLFSCTAKRELPKAYTDLKMFVLDQNNTGYMYMMFFKTTEDSIGYIEAFNLQRNIYNSSKYEEFNKEILFEDIMKEKHHLSCNELNLCFIPDTKILSFYKENSIDSFIDMYANPLGENGYTVDYKLNGEEKRTVAYCLYLNGIYTVWDGYIGFYVFSKEKPKLKKAEEVELIPLDENIL